MNIHTYSVILTTGSIGIFLALLGLLIWSLTTRSGKRFAITIRYEQYIALIVAIAIAAITFSLVYQLVYETPVCELCWWQRIFLYPVSVISLVALWFRTRETHVTTGILAAFGFYIACYHYYYHFQGYVLGKTLSLPCSYGGLLPACTKSPILVFGFSTIPFMGVMVFGSFLILTYLAFRVRSKSSGNGTLKQILTNFNQSDMEVNQIEKTVVTEPTVSTVIEQKGKPYLLYGALVTAVILIGVAFLFTRGYIVAATVNGSPISRLAIISELEKQGGKQALEAMINEKVVTAEFEKLGITIDDNAVADEIKKIEAQVSAQGGTLDEALAQQGMTMEILQDQIESQLKLEKALADKITVTDEEITAFMKENDVVPPAGTDVAAVKAQIADKLKQEKLQTEAPAWIKEVTDKASVKYYTTY